MHSLSPVPRMITSYLPSARGLYVVPFQSTGGGFGSVSGPDILGGRGGGGARREKKMWGDEKARERGTGTDLDTFPIFLAPLSTAPYARHSLR
jgi:hypothetical protein